MGIILYAYNYIIILIYAILQLHTMVNKYKLHNVVVVCMYVRVMKVKVQSICGLCLKRYSACGGYSDEVERDTNWQLMDRGEPPSLLAYVLTR